MFFRRYSEGLNPVIRLNVLEKLKGATEHHLKLMREYSDKEVALKAAGGIRNLRQLLFVRKLGVKRVGATATAEILNEASGLIENGTDLQSLDLSGITIEN